jgi:hypothetical protein
MAELSKTARQAMNAGAQTREKKVISDAEYVKSLRYDVSNGIHATQEGAKALLRLYDAALVKVAAYENRISDLEADIARRDAAATDAGDDLRDLLDT